MSNRRGDRKGKHVQQQVAHPFQFEHYQDPGQNELIAQLQRLQLQNAELLRFQQFYQQQQLVAAQQAAVASTVVITCPATSSYYNPHHRNIFLGGPILVENWQHEIISRLRGQTVYIYNPRRDDWKPDRQLIKDPSISDDTLARKDAQFSWEYEHFERSNCVVFWFPWETSLSPGMFLQLGRCSMATGKMVFIGIHSRNRDKKVIFEFVKSTMPHAYVTSSLEKLGSSIAYWCSTGKMPVESNSSSSSDSNSTR